MNLQNVNELTQLYVILNPSLSAKKNGSMEEKETNPTLLHKKVNLGEFLIWVKTLLIKIGLVSDNIKQSVNRHGELNEQKNIAS